MDHDTAHDTADDPGHDTGPATRTASPVPTADTPKKRNRVLFASLMGSLIEFYDFQIYATAAALVFPHVLYPSLGTTAAIVLSTLTFGVAFVARPLGSIVFGHLGDRLGRKRTLILSLLLMGGATFLVGLTPSAETIGMAAPIIVILLRVVQGVAAGGEWAGANVFAGEHAPTATRGFWAGFPQVGGALPFILVNLIFLLTSVAMPREEFLSWGWRVPFLFAGVLVLIGLWIRVSVDETPVFTQQIKGAASPGRVPVFDLFRQQGRELSLAVGAACTNSVLSYLWTVTLTARAVTELGFSQNQVLAVNIGGGVVNSAMVLFSAWLCDRVGRRRVIWVAQLAAAAWMILLFPVLGNIGSLWVYALVILVHTSLVGAVYGPLGAFLPELFRTRYRYTGAGVAYSLATIVGGTIVPLASPLILASWGPTALGFFIGLLCAGAAACTLALRETRNSELV